MKKAVIIMGVLLILAVAAGVSAENRSGAFTISPMIGGYDFDDDRSLESWGYDFGLGIGYNFTENLGAELMFSYLHTDADVPLRDIDVYGYQLHLDALYHFMPDKIVVPYLALGIGGLMFDDDDAPFEIDDTFQANAGLGFKVFLTEDLALRADGRYFYGFEDSDSEFAITAGLVYLIGGDKKIKPCVDMDQDGVCDDVDKCPDTAAGLRVNSVGCPETAEPYVVMDKSKDAGGIVKESDKQVVQKEIPATQVVVYFEFDKTTVKSLFHSRLESLAQLMNEYPEVTGVIEGHTDSIGSADYNMALSRKRAEAVREYMRVQFGIDPARFVIEPMGENAPAAANTTAEGRAENRRAVATTNALTITVINQ